MLQLKTRNKKSRTVSPMITPFLISWTRTPTTNKPIILGFTFKIPVTGFMDTDDPGPNGVAALKPPAQLTGG